MTRTREHRHVQRRAARVGGRRLLRPAVGRRQGDSGCARACTGPPRRQPGCRLRLRAGAVGRRRHPDARAHRDPRLDRVVGERLARTTVPGRREPDQRPGDRGPHPLQKQRRWIRPAAAQGADMELFMRMSAYADVGFLAGSRPGLLPDSLHQHAQCGRCRRWTSGSVVPVFEAVLDAVHPRHRGPRATSPCIVHRQLGKEALWAAGRIYDGGGCAAQSSDASCSAPARTKGRRSRRPSPSRWSAGQRCNGRASTRPW